MLITYDIKLPVKCTEMWHKLRKLPIEIDVPQFVSWLIAGSLMWNMQKHFKKEPEHGKDCLKMCLAEADLSVCARNFVKIFKKTHHFF
jgi:hypothetical protein